MLENIVFGNVILEKENAPISYSFSSGIQYISYEDKDLYRLLTFHFSKAKEGTLKIGEKSLSLAELDPSQFMLASFTFKEGGRIYALLEKNKNLSSLFQRCDALSSLSFKEKISSLFTLLDEQTLYYFFDKNEEGAKEILPLIMQAYLTKERKPLVIRNLASPLRISSKKVHRGSKNDIYLLKQTLQNEKGEFIFQFIFMLVSAFIFSYAFYSLSTNPNVVPVVICFVIGLFLSFIFANSTYSVQKKLWKKDAKEQSLMYLSFISGATGSISGLLCFAASFLIPYIPGLSDLLSFARSGITFTGFLIIFLSFFLSSFSSFIIKTKKRKSSL